MNRLLIRKPTVVIKYNAFSVKKTIESLSKPPFFTQVRTKSIKRLLKSTTVIVRSSLRPTHNTLPKYPEVLNWVISSYHFSVKTPKKHTLDTLFNKSDSRGFYPTDKGTRRFLLKTFSSSIEKGIYSFLQLEGP